MAVAQRLQKLRQKLVESELDAILISQLENLRYLSGFTGSSGWLLVSSDSAILATDFRYLEQAKKQASSDFRVIQIKDGIPQWFPKLMAEVEAKVLGFEANNLCFANYQRLVEEASKLQIQLTPTQGLVGALRAVKEEEELKCLEKAVELADAAVEYISSKIHPGMKEKEVAWEIEKFLRERGSEAIPFNIIVASGPNSALPHAEPTERLICAHEPIIIDLGAWVEGYCSDISRTICLGSPDQTFVEIYDLVLEAQLAAIAELKVGITGEQIDHLARTLIEQRGYGDAFGHGLGHGVGLAAHEEPRLGSNSTSVLAQGMVFTIEPGVYLPGWGGVRIEDMVTLEQGKPRVLTKARKDREAR